MCPLYQQQRGVIVQLDAWRGLPTPPRRLPRADLHDPVGLELGHDLRDLLREPRAHGRDGFHRLLVVHDAHVRVRVGRDEPDERGSGQSSKAKEMSDGVVR